MFELLNIIQPTWYYNLLKSKTNNLYWVDFRKISKKNRNMVDYCNLYESQIGSLFDASFQLFRNGYISKNENDKMKYYDLNELSINDQYIFIRRFYKPIWSYYILFYRLFTFNNPLKELSSFAKSFRASNLKHCNVFQHKDYDSFESKIVHDNPLVSIIIPTLNRYKYLYNALKDIENQTYKNFEVIIVDQSDDFNRLFYEDFKFNIKLIKQKQKALWLARNKAIKISKGEFILLYDDDSKVSKTWIENHLKCIDYFSVDISSGVSRASVGAKVPKSYSFFRWADQLDTGNVMLRRQVFKTCNLFDKQFEKMRQGDDEFGIRSTLKGFRSVSNHKAYRTHLKVESGGLREMGSWDGFRSIKFFKPKPIPKIFILL